MQFQSARWPAILILILTGIIFPATVTEVRVHGNQSVSAKAVIRVSGLTPGVAPDKAAEHKAVRDLLSTGYFDTVYIKTERPDSATAVLHIVVRERGKHDFFIYGGTISRNMYGTEKYWLSAVPGYRRRFLFRRFQTFDFTMQFPYQYGLTASWQAAAFPARAFNTRITAGARSAPYQYSAYHMNSAYASLTVEREIWPRLYLGVSAAEDISRTWRIDTEKWGDLDWQAFTLDPSDFQDRSPGVSAYYPRTEHAPEFGCYLRFDRRDSPVYPTRGYYLYLKGSHHRIYKPEDDYLFTFNQAYGNARVYFSPRKRHVFAACASATSRDTFDPVGLGHRLISYDHDRHFRGFRYLFGTNIAFLDLEYRYKLLEVRFEDLELGIRLNPKMEKFMKRLSYIIDFFAYVDNGLFFGHVYSGEWERIPFVDLNPADDLYTAAGAGLRLVYPGLGYSGALGCTFAHRKPGLDKDYKTWFFATLTTSF